MFVDSTTRNTPTGCLQGRRGQVKAFVEPLDGAFQLVLGIGLVGVMPQWPLIVGGLSDAELSTHIGDREARTAKDYAARNVAAPLLKRQLSEPNTDFYRDEPGLAPLRTMASFRQFLNELLELKQDDGKS
jgi:hypothetical protein